MEVLVRPMQRVLQVQPGANLLESLLAHQVPMSHSCRAGRCSTCRCRIVEGDALEADEGGYVLACQTHLTEPCTIEIPEPDEIVVHPARIVKASVAAIEDLTHDIKRLVLQPAKPLDYSPGQYAQLQFTPEHARPYSMAGLMDDGALEFHVRVVPEGRVSSYVAQVLKVGDAVRVSGPLGSAYLRRRHEGPMLCVAGGTGLAPILAILRGAIAGGMRNPIHLYFGVRSARDVYGLHWLRHLQRQHPALDVHLVAAAGDSQALRRGLVTDAIAADLGELAGWRAYLCGSPPMVEATTRLVQQRGLETEHIHADAFYPQGT